MSDMTLDSKFLLGNLNTMKGKKIKTFNEFMSSLKRCKVTHDSEFNEITWKKIENEFIIKKWNELSVKLIKYVSWQRKSKNVTDTL